MTIHLGEQEPESLEGLLLGAGEPLDSVPVPDERALADPIAFGLLVHHFNPGHRLNQSRHVEVLFLLGDPERDSFGLGRFPGTVLIGLILLGDLGAAGGVASPLRFPVPQEVQNFVAET